MDSGKPQLQELRGRVALVTGAGRNIGRAIALALADAGAAVVLNARQSASEINAVHSEIEAKKQQSLPILADISDEAAVGRMVAAALERSSRSSASTAGAGAKSPA